MQRHAFLLLSHFTLCCSDEKACKIIEDGNAFTFNYKNRSLYLLFSFCRTGNL